MERILTKEEIAELLSAVHSGQIETETETSPVIAPEKSVKRFDLIRASVGSGRWQSANFDVLLDSFARNHGISLTNRLQRSATIRRREVEAMNFDPFLLQLTENGAVGLIRLESLSHGGLLFFDSALSYGLVEIMLGGSSGMEPIIPNRPLTTIEVNLVKTVMESACVDLRKAFIPLDDLVTSLIKVEIDPRMINIATPETEMMVATYDVVIDTVKTVMKLAIPYLALEPLRDKLREGPLEIKAKPDNTWTQAIKKLLTCTELEVAAQLGEMSLTIRDIIDLRVGDIIDLNFDPDQPMRILVAGKPKYQGLISIRNGKKTVHITGNPLEVEADENI